MGVKLGEKKGTLTVLAAGLALSSAGSVANAELQREQRTNTLVLSAVELQPGWGGTHLGAITPGLSLLGFDDAGGLRSIAEVEVFARLTVSNVRVRVLDTAMTDHVLQAGPGSAFGASVNSSVTLLDPVTQWQTDAFEPADLPGFGAAGDVTMSFSQTADLSSLVTNTFALNNPTYDVNIGALLDARALFSPNGSFEVLGPVNDVSEWTITIEAWANYDYSLVPAPSGVAVLGLAGILAARRRR